MSDKQAYLGRSLNQRSYDAAELADAAMQMSMRQNNLVGRLASGSTLISLRADSLRVFSEEFDKAAQFTFNLMESNGEEVIKQLAYCAGRMADLIMEKVKICGMHTGIAEATVAREINNIRVALDERRVRVLDDFAHGMMGSQRLKKDPVVNIVNNQNNSPGAVQQIGVGDKFSQQAFVQNHQPLIDSINKAVASPEFAKLQPEQKDGFKDVADTLLEEAKKEHPDPGKLKRWGTRLGELATQLGLHVAATEIVHIVGKMFT